jgi:hypothetical protein
MIPAAPFVRILLRYVSGLLVSAGFFAPADALAVVSDPELVQAVTVGAGVAVGAAAEFAYSLARKRGGPT